ncbi:MAG: hypothetical protein J5736_05350, partial [Bacilli bacterium]|nr:hypothetical protein [Bacilli bacterium]
NQRIKGKQTLPCSIHDEPLYFVKGGSIIYDGETFFVYPLEEGVFSSTYLLDDGVSPLKEGNHAFVNFEIFCGKEAIHIHVEGKKKPRIEVIGADGRKVVVD